MPGTVLAIRHVAFEDLGFFEAPLIEAGYRIRYLDAGDGNVAAPDPLAPELLIVLGGPMGVYERADYPFLDDELQLIAARLAARRRMLGVCLGAQLMAHALGARVYPGPVKEIGFAPVTLTNAGRASPLAPLAAGQPVLHWHGDTFDLPEGATLLASTPSYANQAFAIGTHVLAMQFHLEAGAPIEPWLDGNADELRTEGLASEPIRQAAAQHADGLCATAHAVLSAWLRAA